MRLYQLVFHINTITSVYLNSHVGDKLAVVMIILGTGSVLCPVEFVTVIKSN